jgi:hypothetical protein
MKILSDLAPYGIAIIAVFIAGGKLGPMVLEQLQKLTI